MAYDLVLKNGRVIDPSQGIDRLTDVAFAGGNVAEVGDGLSGADIRDVTGRIVTPGLIDLHTHVYWGGTSLGVDVDQCARTSAVTTSVDTGSAGPGNFPGFRKHVIEQSDSRILVYLHVSFAGIFAFSNTVMVGESHDLRLMAAREAVAVANANRDVIVGIKVRIGRHASGPSLIAPLTVALQVGEETGLPVMAHIDEPPPMYLIAAGPDLDVTGAERHAEHLPAQGAGGPEQGDGHRRREPRRPRHRLQAHLMSARPSPLGG